MHQHVQPDYAYFGGWGFLRQNHLANATLLLPCAAMIGLLLFFFTRLSTNRRERYRDPAQIAISAHGIYLRFNHGEFWWDWPEIVEIKTSEKKVSFLPAGLIDPLVTELRVFDDEAAFLAYRNSLKERFDQSQTPP